MVRGRQRQRKSERCRVTGSKRQELSGSQALPWGEGVVGRVRSPMGARVSPGQKEPGQVDASDPCRDWTRRHPKVFSRAPTSGLGVTDVQRGHHHTVHRDRVGMGWRGLHMQSSSPGKDSRS